VQYGFRAFDFNTDQGVQAFLQRPFTMIEFVLQRAGQQLEGPLDRLFAINVEIYWDLIILKANKYFHVNHLLIQWFHSTYCKAENLKTD